MSDKVRISKQAVLSYFAPCEDVVIREVRISPDCADHEDVPFLIYCDGLVEDKLINESVISRLQLLSIVEDTADHSSIWMNAKQLRPDRQAALTTIAEEVFAGQLVVVYPASDSLVISVNIAKRPERTTEESNTESSIKGARDGFTEQLSTNVALLRKRLRSPKLAFKRFTIGTRSKTEVGLLYFNDLVSPSIIDEAQRRLLAVHTEGLIGINQLEDALSDSPYHMIPLVDYIGRPDFAAKNLLSGRFIVLMDGSPMAIIAPINMALLLQSPEDDQVSFYIAAFQRSIRYLGPRYMPAAALMSTGRFYSSKGDSSTL